MSIAGIEVWRILALFMAILIAFVAGRMTRFFLRRADDHLDERYPSVLALAAQDTIKNFFGSLRLFVDKLFEMGDRIVVGDTDGPVEEVGLRSTRIRTLEGHLVTIPKGKLAHEKIRNISKRPYLKRVANTTVTYDTPPDYWKFMAFNQRINLAILGRFNDEGIGFAFPTQTLYLAGDPNRPLDRRPEKRTE